MLIVMKQGATPDELQGVMDAVQARGYKAHAIPGGRAAAIATNAFSKAGEHS